MMDNVAKARKRKPLRYGKLDVGARASVSLLAGMPVTSRATAKEKDASSSELFVIKEITTTSIFAKDDARSIEVLKTSFLKLVFMKKV